MKLYGDDVIASDDAMPLLLEAARNYRLAGGTVTPETWVHLSRNEQVALAAIGAELAGLTVEDEAEQLLADGMAQTLEVLERRCG